MIVMSLLRTRTHVPVLISYRFSGHGNAMPIRPSPFVWHKFKDFLHMYFMVGLIPTTAVATYVNLTVGPAELSETPEGYEPAFWEYEKHPMIRLFTRTFFEHPAEDYERRMHLVIREDEKTICRRITIQVENIMAIRNDQQSWYYMPFSAKYARRMRDFYHRFSHKIGLYMQRYDVEEDLSSLSSPSSSDTGLG